MVEKIDSMPILDDRFYLLKTLGTGATSKVKLGVEKEQGLKVAVKILKQSATPKQKQKLLESMVKEIKAMQELEHPNVIRMYDFGDEGKIVRPDGAESTQNVFVVLELAKGGLLFDYVSFGAFPEPISRLYFQQMIKALAYVHSKGFAHRDMKLENILLDDQFNLKIADFGFVADVQSVLQTYAGTPRYMAPEILQNRPYDGASVDLFAAGNILFSFVAGHAPYKGATPDDHWYSKIY